MKTFLISVSVLIVIIIFVTVSAFALVNIGKKLCEIARNFPPAAENNSSPQYNSFNSALNKFNEIWNQKKLFIHLVVGHTEGQAIEDTLEELIVRYACNDSPGYMSARRKLISAIERIISSESFSIDSIF